MWVKNPKKERERVGDTRLGRYGSLELGVAVGVASREGARALGVEALRELFARGRGRDRVLRAVRRCL